MTAVRVMMIVRFNCMLVVFLNLRTVFLVNLFSRCSFDMRKVAPRLESPSSAAKSSVFNAPWVFERLTTSASSSSSQSSKSTSKFGIGDRHQLLRTGQPYPPGSGTSASGRHLRPCTRPVRDERGSTPCLPGIRRRVPTETCLWILRTESGKIDFRAFPISSKAFSGSIRLTIVRISSMVLI